MLLMTRGNYPIYLMRSTWEARGKGFTDKGVLIRCVRQDRSHCVSEILVSRQLQRLMSTI